VPAVVLPWPPKGLQPHAKGHWRPKAKATKAYRAEARKRAEAVGVARDPGAVLTITCHPPDRRRRDCQNMPSQLKAAIDGIADAMGCDDKGFRVRFPEAFAEPVADGSVVIVVSRPATEAPSP
jgi:crossover junction endodeoxyribonuclease RusA